MILTEQYGYFSNNFSIVIQDSIIFFLSHTDSNEVFPT